MPHFFSNSRNRIYSRILSNDLPHLRPTIDPVSFISESLKSNEEILCFMKSATKAPARPRHISRGKERSCRFSETGAHYRFRVSLMHRELSTKRELTTISPITHFFNPTYIANTIRIETAAAAAAAAEARASFPLSLPLSLYLSLSFSRRNNYAMWSPLLPLSSNFCICVKSDIN